MRRSNYFRVLAVLDWLLDHGQEDRRVSLGCKTCNQSHNLLASTARTSWLVPFHDGHEVWIRSPFAKRGKS